MKIWITRQSAFSLQSGGLERCFVWFRKPSWVDIWSDKNDPLPFGDDNTDQRGRKHSAWEVRQINNVGTSIMWMEKSLSFGNLFGYSDRDSSEDDIATYTWDKLIEHFGNTDFEHWHVYERENPETCNIRNFLLEIDIKVSL